jgi:hypothetical protein
MELKSKTDQTKKVKEPRAKAKPKPRTSNRPKTPGAKVIVKATDVLTDDILNDDDDVVSIVPHDGLNPRQLLFVEHFVRTLNARLSVELAGYEGTYNSMCVMGSRLLSNVKVAKAITWRLEHYVMAKGEIMARLSRIARGSIGSFLKIEEDALGRKTARLDLTSDEAQDNLDLLREYDGKTIDKIALESDGGDKSTLQVNQTHIKMHDSLKAMEFLVRMYEKMPPEPIKQPPPLTVNGEVVGNPEATISFISKALGVPPDQIPVEPYE